jgi:glutaredoxin
MEFERPIKKGFTIFSKSGCPNCNKVKALLQEKKEYFVVINCDEYIIENKENFLLFIKEISTTDHKIFPFVFHDGFFIGGYQETQKYIDKLLLTFE